MGLNEEQGIQQQSRWDYNLFILSKVTRSAQLSKIPTIHLWRRSKINLRHCFPDWTEEDFGHGTSIDRDKEKNFSDDHHFPLSPARAHWVLRIPRFIPRQEEDSATRGGRERGEAKKNFSEMQISISGIGLYWRRLRPRNIDPDLKKPDDNPTSISGGCSWAEKLP